VVSSGNFLLVFWDNLSVPSSRVKNQKKDLILDPCKIGKIDGPGMLVRNYHYLLLNNQEEHIISYFVA